MLRELFMEAQKGLHQQKQEQAAGKSVLTVQNLKKYFPLKGLGYFPWSHKPQVKAVDGISFEIKQNEMLGLAGESGCGKSTVGRLILNLIKATSGQIYFRENEITALSKAQTRHLRPRMQMVFQDPYTSLNPRRTVADIISEPLVVHTSFSARERKQKTLHIMERVGLLENHYYRYPHEFSGGQRQRIAIARALILKPDFLVLDEPTSALDVSVQAVIVNLIKKLQKELELSCLFITHDLNLLRFMSDRVAIMYLGKIMELALAEDVFETPLHPYTKALISITPDPVPGMTEKRYYLEGEVPSNVVPPSGCPFNTRCPSKIGTICETVEPKLTKIGTRIVRCHLFRPEGTKDL